MIEAVLALNEYLEAAVQGHSLTIGNVYPGNYAPASENGNKYLLYHVVPNDVHQLYGLKNDLVTYTMYNADFIELHKIAKVIKDTLNVENIQDESLAETGVRFLETVYTSTGQGEASYVDGTSYYTLSFSVQLRYTEG